MKYYVCAGIRRSGSTVLFNMVRLAIEYVYGSGKVYSGFYNGECLSCDTYKAHNVIKVHEFYESLCSPGVVLTTIRDFRDIASSLIIRGLLHPCR